MMKTLTARVLCLMLSALCVLTCFPGAAAQELQPPTYIQTCLIRNTPSNRGAVIGRMEDGTAVEILGESGDFYRIDCYDMTGYIAKAQVTAAEDVGYYVNCQSDSPETSPLECRSAAEVLRLRSAILRLTRQQLGTRYVYGGSAPGGFDCSGLTSYVYKKNGITLHRRASLQMQDGLIVSKEGLQVGDLVFFRTPGTTTLCSHVGIYAGENTIIHAGSKGITYANLDDNWFDDYYLCGRRILNISGASLEPVIAVAAENGTTRAGAIGIRTTR